jgi:hypothetical protein
MYVRRLVATFNGDRAGLAVMATRGRDMALQKVAGLVIYLSGTEGRPGYSSVTFLLRSGSLATQSRLRYSHLNLALPQDSYTSHPSRLRRDSARP